MRWMEELVRRPRLGVALGGGAARGLAHIGVLGVLEEAGLHPDLLGGVSFGAFVGAVYAHVGSAEEVQRRFQIFTSGDVFRGSRLQFFFQESDPESEGGFFAAMSALMKQGLFYTTALRRRGYLAQEEFSALVDGVVPDLRIEHVGIPFFAVAADLRSGSPVVMDRGSLREAVKASSAIPGVMPPIDRDGRLLVDGGCVTKMPADELRARGADVVVGVDVASYPPMEREGGVRGIDVILRSYALKDQALRRRDLARCDAVIHVPLDEIHWADFDRIDDCVLVGRREAEARLPRLLRLMERAGGWRSRWGRLRGGTSSLAPSLQ